jgi:hypothetical protein
MNGLLAAVSAIGVKVAANDEPSREGVRWQKFEKK